MKPELLQVQQVSSRIIELTFFGNDGEYQVQQQFNTRQECTDRMDELTAEGHFIYVPKK
jgi:hypothetical protein